MPAVSNIFHYLSTLCSLSVTLRSCPCAVLFGRHTLLFPSHLSPAQPHLSNSSSFSSSSLHSSWDSAWTYHSDWTEYPSHVICHHTPSCFGFDFVVFKLNSIFYSDFTSVCINVLFSIPVSNQEITLHLVVCVLNVLLICDFLVFPCFLWPWQFWGVLARYFVETLNLGFLMFFSWLYWGCGCRGGRPQQRAILITSCQRYNMINIDFSLLILTLTTWLRSCLSGLSTIS